MLCPWWKEVSVPNPFLRPLNVEETLGLVAVRVRPWADLHNATPFADLASAQDLVRKTCPDADFDSRSVAVLGRGEFNALRSNLNDGSIRWMGTTSRYYSLGSVNEALAYYNLPQLILAHSFCADWPAGWVLVVGVPPDSQPFCPDGDQERPWHKAVEPTMTYPRVLLRVG